MSVSRLVAARPFPLRLWEGRDIVQPEGVPRPIGATTSDPHRAGPSRRRTHRCTRDIVARAEGPQQPPARDVHIVQPEVVQRAGVAAGDHPWRVRPRRSMSRGGRAQEVPMANAQVGAPEDYAPGSIGP